MIRKGKMRWNSVAGSCGVMLVLAVSALAQPTTGEFSPVETTLPERIQEVLGIEVTNADILTPLAEIIEVLGKDSVRTERAIVRLVDAFNSGPRPEALPSVLLPAIHIDWDSTYQSNPPPSWKYGTSQSREDLGNLLWARSEGYMKDGNVKEASRYARAALLLAAQSDFRSAPSASVKIIAQANKDGQLARRLGLTDDQANQLLATMTDAQTRAREFYAGYRAAMVAIEKFRKLKADGATPVAFQSALEELKKLKPLGLSEHFKRANAAWEFRNLLKLWNRPNDVAALDAVLNGWRNESANPHVKRWLTEATERVGRPRRLLVITQVNPDGTETEVDE